MVSDRDDAHGQRRGGRRGRVRRWRERCRAKLIDWSIVDAIDERHILTEPAPIEADDIVARERLGKGLGKTPV